MSEDKAKYTVLDQQEARSISGLLEEMPERIERAAQKKNDALEAYRRAEAKLENEQARIIQTEKTQVLGEIDREFERVMAAPKSEADKRMKLLKLHMPTIEDLKAVAVQETYDMRLDVIEKESAWRARAKEFDRLRDEFTALQERSFNFRATLKALRG